MYLQRIELQGFKSFAKKAVLEFPTPAIGHKTPSKNKQNNMPKGSCGITSVVGPNGSGKSNIVDAVRWVLGEQSLKLLRGKKSTDVIFAGSNGKSKMGLAEVSLYLNNEDGATPIDYSEIVITRKLYRDGNSEYLLNKQPVRLFDVVMLLAKANFGQNTYSVIGQGMIDKIVNYSANDRKEFFDEATGVKQFQIKRDKSVNKLKRARQNVEQVRSLISELEPHLKTLTRQVNRLHKRQKVETDLRQWQIKYYGKKWRILDDNYQKQAIEFSKTEKEKIYFENKINEAENRLMMLSKEESRKDEFDSLSAEYEKLNNKQNGLYRELSEIKGKLDVEYLKIGKQDLSWLENRRDDLIYQKKEINYQTQKLEASIDKANKALIVKQKEQEKVLAGFKSLEKKLLEAQKEFKKDIGLSEKEIRQAINRIYSLQKDFVYKLRSALGDDDLKKLKLEADVIYNEVEDFYNKVSRQEKEDQSQEMLRLQNKLSSYLKSKDSMVNEINELRITLEVEGSRHKALVAKKEELGAELAKTENKLEQNKVKPENEGEIYSNLRQDKQRISASLDELAKQVNEIKNKIDDFNESEEIKKQKIFTLQQEVHGYQTELNKVISVLNNIKIELSKTETKKEDLFSSMRYDLGEDYRPKFDKEFEEVDLQDAEDKINKLRRQLELIGGTDPEAEKEYNEVKERFDFLSKQNDDLQSAITDLEKVVIKLDKMIKNQFESEFTKINKDFSKYFKQLFDGGSAKLVLSQDEMTEAEEEVQKVGADDTNSVSGTDEMDKAEEGEPKKKVYVEDKSFLANMGIDITASPPGKKINNINVLSGGEKTMTSLALICAIIANNPSPFILFDEVDAALDEANSAKFANIIEDLSHKTQFIIITHNRAIMAGANVLYGVTMQGDGVSRLIGLKLDEAEKLSKTSAKYE